MTAREPGIGSVAGDQAASGRRGQTTDCGTADVGRIQLAGEWPSIKAPSRLCGERQPALAAIVVLAIIAFLLEGIGIGLLIPLVEGLLSGDEARSTFGPFTAAMQSATAALPADHRLPLIAGIVFLLILLKTIVIYSQKVLSIWLGGHVGQTLRVQLFEKTLAVGLLTLQKLGRCRLYNTIYFQAWQVTSGLETLSRIIASAAAILVFVTMLLLISWPLSSAVVAGFFLVSLIMLAVRRECSEGGPSPGHGQRGTLRSHR